MKLKQRKSPLGVDLKRAGFGMRSARTSGARGFKYEGRSCASGPYRAGTMQADRRTAHATTESATAMQLSMHSRPFYVRSSQPSQWRPHPHLACYGQACHRRIPMPSIRSWSRRCDARVSRPRRCCRKKTTTATEVYPP